MEVISPLQREALRLSNVGGSEGVNRRPSVRLALKNPARHGGHMPVILATGSLRQEDCMREASLGNLGRFISLN